MDNAIYTARWWDGRETLANGTLSELSARYLAFVKSRPDIRHGPATLRRDGQDAGFINAKGEAWLKQPGHFLAYSPED